MFVEGNADLTPAKLVGHHNPARVLREDYRADNFVDGPLLEAMREGGFLYTLVEHGTGADASYPDVVFDAMVVALSGRIFLDETVELTPEAVLRQIWEDHFILNPAAAAPR